MGPLHGTAHADGYSWKVRSVQKNTTHNWGTTSGLLNLFNRNQLRVPIEAYSFYKKSESDLNPKVIGSKLSPYFESANLAGYALPQAAYVLEQTTPLNLCTTTVTGGCFTPAKINNGTLSRDNAYNKPRVLFDSYDNNGNLTLYSQPNNAVDLSDKISTKLDWLTRTIPTTIGSNSVNFVLSVLGTETKNFGKTPALSTNYNYVIPIEGLKTLTQPNGISMSYDYDSFSRLASVKNAKGEIVKSHKYNYLSK